MKEHYSGKKKRNDALTDATDTFRLGSWGDLSFIGDFTVVKEEHKIHVQSAALIWLQRDKDRVRSSGSNLSLFN